MKIEVANTKKIIALHNEITEALKSSLEKAILIGQLLIEQKEKLKHGEFTKWITDSLPFTVRTTQNYMRTYSNRDELKNESVSLLGRAYKLLAAPKGNQAILEKIESMLGPFSLVSPPVSVNWEEIESKLLASPSKPIDWEEINSLIPKTKDIKEITSWEECE